MTKILNTNQLKLVEAVRNLKEGYVLTDIPLEIIFPGRALHPYITNEEKKQIHSDLVIIMAKTRQRKLMKYVCFSKMTVSIGKDIHR